MSWVYDNLKLTIISLIDLVSHYFGEHALVIIFGVAIISFIINLSNIVFANESKSMPQSVLFSVSNGLTVFAVGYLPAKILHINIWVSITPPMR